MYVLYVHLPAHQTLLNTGKHQMWARQIHLVDALNPIPNVFIPMKWTGCKPGMPVL